MSEFDAVDLAGREIVWKPWPKQRLWLSCPIYEAMAGGAAGPGKTDWIIMDAIAGEKSQLRLANEYYERTGIKSRGRALLIRKSFNRLKDIIARCQTMFPIIDPGVRYSSVDHMFYFSCGYRYELGHLEGPGDEQNYHGQEFTFLGFDQVEEISQGQYVFLKSRVRTTDPALKETLRVRSTANPGGPHGAWVKKYFIDPCPEGMKPIVEIVDIGMGKKASTERIFMPGRWYDNPSLPESYLVTLSSLAPHLVRMLRDGDWDATADSFFGDVWEARTHVCKPFTIPESWHKFRSGDFGTLNPSCIQWWAVDHDGNLTCYRELYIRPKHAEDLAHRIREIEMDHNEWSPERGSLLTGPLDPACWNKAAVRGINGQSVYETMANMGVWWFAGDNNRIPGWDQMRRRMTLRSGFESSVPGIRWFESCRDSVRTIPNLLPKDYSVIEMEEGKRAEDMDTKGEDHAADAARYACMSRPLVPPKRSELEEEEMDDELYLRRMRQRGRLGYGGQ